MLNLLNTMEACQLRNLILQEAIAYLLNIYTYAFIIALYTTIIHKDYLWNIPDSNRTVVAAVPINASPGFHFASEHIPYVL